MAEVKTILMNAFSAKVGGGVTYVNNLLARLPSDDFRLLVYAPEDIKLPEDPRIVRLRTKWPTDNPVLRGWWERWLLPIVIKKQRAEILFCPGGVYSTKPSSQFKIVTMFRNMLPFDSRILSTSDSIKQKIKNVLLKKMMLRSMSNADHVIFISDYARQLIESLTPIKKAVTIPHGISSHFGVAGKSLPRPELPFAGKYILYVSRFEFYKRHMEVVKAYQLLPASLKREYRLLLVGGTDLPTGQAVLEYVKAQNLQDVTLLGHYAYNKLPDLYRNASLILFASACENCPNILLESMGAGVPVLCSNYEPMPEFGGDAVTYMNPDDPSEIAQKIRECLAEPADSKSAALSQQASRFNWDITAKRTWEVLLGL